MFSTSAPRAKRRSNNLQNVLIFQETKPHEQADEIDLKEDSGPVSSHR